MCKWMCFSNQRRDGKEQFQQLGQQKQKGGGGVNACWINEKHKRSYCCRVWGAPLASFGPQGEPRHPHEPAITMHWLLIMTPPPNTVDCNCFAGGALAVFGCAVSEFTCVYVYVCLCERSVHLLMHACSCKHPFHWKLVLKVSVERGEDMLFISRWNWPRDKDVEENLGGSLWNK